MKHYYCPHCDNNFLECELIKTKCSENGVKTYIDTICPKCIKKRVPVYSELKEGDNNKW